MNKIYEDLQTLQNIYKIKSGIESMGPMSNNNVEDKSVKDELDSIRSQIKTSCKKLLKDLNDEDIAKIDVCQLTKMFGDDRKKEIITILVK